MNKKLSLILALALMLTAVITAVASVSGASYFPKVLILGDSISTGYGLQGEKSSPDAYANLLADYLNVRPGNLINEAVNGADSADLKAQLPSLKDKIMAADLIVVTIGGNDLLNIVWNAADKVLPGGYQDPSQLLIIKEDPVMMEKMKSYITLSTITQAMTKYSANIKQISTQIQKMNPDAPVLYLNQYNPFEGVQELAGMESLITTGINSLNNMTIRGIAKRGTLVDVHSVFVGHAQEWTRIADFDIHPNEAGHKVIFQTLKKTVDKLTASMPTPTDPETEEPPVTQAPETDAPVTNVPETDAPVTNAPETNAPETDAPETDAPVTNAPETNAPETDAPETNAPETDAPETDTPVTNAPETDAPETDAPETDAPETDAPETDAPVTNAPETDAPVTNAPETDAPVTNTPETDPPKQTEAPETPAPETDPPKQTDAPETPAPETDPGKQTQLPTETDAPGTDGASRPQTTAKPQSTSGTADTDAGKKESGCGAFAAPILPLIAVTLLGCGAWKSKKH